MSASRTGEVPAAHLVIWFFLGLLLFFGLLLYFRNHAFEGVLQPPKGAPVPGVPSNFDRAYDLPDLYIRELLVPDYELQVKLAIAVRPESGSSLAPNELLEATRYFAYTREPSTALAPPLTKYAAAQFNSKRAIAQDPVEIQLDGQPVAFARFHTGKDIYYAYGMLNGEDQQAVILASTEGEPVGRERLQTLLQMIDELKPLLPENSSRDVAERSS